MLTNKNWIITKIPGNFLTTPSYTVFSVPGPPPTTTRSRGMSNISLLQMYDSRSDRNLIYLIWVNRWKGEWGRVATTYSISCPNTSFSSRICFCPSTSTKWVWYGFNGGAPPGSAVYSIVLLLGYTKNESVLFPSLPSPHLPVIFVCYSTRCMRQCQCTEYIWKH